MKIAILLSASLALLGTISAETQFSAEVDYLLFQAHQDGFFRATDIFLPAQAYTVAYQKDKYIEDNRWNSGVRASLSWEPECRPWNLNLQYTYLGRTIPSKKLEGVFNGNTTTENNDLVFTDYVTNTVSIPATYANEASWKFSFNQLDLLIEQPFCIGEETTLVPYFGLRGLRLTQKVEMSTLNVIPNGPETGTIAVHQVSIQPKFEGIGLLGGFEGRFVLGYGFDLWGRFGGGLIWGRFKTVQAASATPIRATLPVGAETIDHTFWGTSLNGNFGLGIEWSCPLNCGCQWLSVTFGWENHLYTKTNNAQTFLVEQFSIDPNKAITLDRNIQRGDFSMQGFSLGVAYLF